MKSVQISVIIPVFNQEKYIGRCLRSLLKQTISSNDFEIIVINDGSSDNTEKALSLFMNDIIYIKNKKQKGLPASLNIGIKNAKGQFIIRVDSDDYVHWEYLNILSMYLQLNHDIDAVSCDYYLVDSFQNIISHNNCLDQPIGCGIMFRIEQLIEIGLYDEEFLTREEEDLRVRFLKHYQIVRLQLPLYRYRRHATNITNNKESMVKFSKRLNDKHTK